MSTKVSSQSELYQVYKDEVQGNTSDLTDFSEGSLHDVLAGALTIAQNELSELMVNEFMKTYFKMAKGADLENLATDHFGETFSRPSANKATGAITFTRANNAAGDVVIAIGTIVKTKKDPTGKEIRFETTAEVTLLGTTINAPVKAIIAGTDGNVGIGKVIVLETALTDPSVTVSNIATMAGGTNAPEDAEYLEYIRQKVLALAGATEAAVEGAAKAVEGVALAKIVVEERVVIDYDIATGEIVDGAVFFRIPQPKIYIADAAGNASQGLIDAVRAGIAPVKAAGVRFDVLGAVPIEIDWFADIELNPAGPNYAELSVDLIKITDSMRDYINKQLAIGGGFNKAAANAYMLSVWGAAGTNDLNAFVTTIPAGNVGIAINQKLISGDIGIN